MSDDESWKCFLNDPLVSSDAQLRSEIVIVGGQETYQTAIENELYNVQQFSSPSGDHLSQAVAATECDKKVPLTVMSVQDTVRHSSFAGEYNFKVRFAPQKKIAKAALWTFSESLQKLYANVNKECPVCFCVTRPLPFGAKIRCKAVYRSINHQQDVVTRCWNHIVQSSSANGTISNYHFILCDNRTATYHDDLSTGQQSVTATFEPDGNLQAVLVFRFMCFSSCVGNMTRRQIDVVFSLETETGTVLGRQVFELKICACPGRDRREDELNRVREGADLPTKRVKRRSETSPSGEGKMLKILTETSSNQTASDNDDDQVYSIEVRGKRMYNYVLTVIKAAQELRGGQLNSSPPQSDQPPIPKSKPVVSANVPVII